MRKIDKIFIHCSDTPVQMDVGVKEIRKWHKARNWRDIGYHYVIRLNGTIELGRPIEETGAHVKEHNSTSIAVCYVGGQSRSGEQGVDTRTSEQKISMLKLLRTLLTLFPGARIAGHNEVDQNKWYCPGFDVNSEL